jgi:hypothetical protein
MSKRETLLEMGFLESQVMDALKSCGKVANSIVSLTTV